MHGVLRLSVVVLVFVAGRGHAFVGNMLCGRGVLRGAQRARSVLGKSYYTWPVLDLAVGVELCRMDGGTCVLGVTLRF